MFRIGRPALRTDNRPARLGPATDATANHRQPRNGEGNNDKHDDDGHRTHVSTTLLPGGCLLSVGSVPQSGGRRTYTDVTLLERRDKEGQLPITISGNERLSLLLYILLKIKHTPCRAR